MGTDTYQFCHHENQTDSSKGPSGKIWAHYSGLTLPPDGVRADADFDEDFVNAGGTVTTNVGGWGGYKTYEDTNTSILPTPGKGGVLRLSTPATDNLEAWIQAGYSVGTLVSIDTSDPQPLAFECRFKLGAVANNQNVFIGLGEPGLAAADTITDAGALASKDLIGFHIAESDGDALTFVYRKAGQAAQTVLTYGTALVAGTWYKAGFLYNPQAPASERIKVYVNGAEQTTKVTQTNIAAATFPDGEGLHVLAGVKNGAGTALTVDLDWIRCRQPR